MTASAFPTPAGSEVDAQPDFELIESETPESGAKTPTEDQPEDAIKTEPEAETPSSDDADVKKAESEEEPTKPMIQNVYRHDCMYNAESCPTRWSKFAVIQEEQEKLEAEIASIPIVHRQIYSDDKEWVTFSVTVNDPHMRSLLSRALEGYFPDPDALDLQNWTFEQSYEPIVHRWDKLRSLHQEIKTSSTSTPEQIRSVDAFIEFAEPLIKPCIEAIAKTRESGKVSYDDLWQIYSPGQLCVTKFYEVETLVRVTKNHKSDSREIFEVQVEFLEWNGSRCALKKTWISMGKFEGSQKVKSFSLVPLSFTDNPDELRETMSKRGQKFQDLRGYHYRAYDGLSVEMGIPIMRPVTGRVIIDAHAFYRARNLVQLDDIKSAAAKAGGDDDEEPKGGEEADEAAEDSDAEGNAKKSSPLVAIPSPQQGTERQEDLSPLSDEDSLITSPWLIGFEIKTKKWARFCINNLTDIQWNDKAFDNLVSRGGEKHLAWEFVESKARSKQNVNDFVHEKGKGITILMFGPPGVGKTFTAEAVAERARVPLYVISAGVLSTKPAELEAGLDHALELCRMWNAMLLLDEADVFLSVRSDEGLMRNELVSIFLTKLEYYQGILFLTTNRFSSIDHAFQSRVDLFLPYYDLDATSRRQVWQNFFAHFGQDKFKGITDREMDRLCDLNLNGREIKNLCKSALLLSERDISADKDGRMMAEKLLHAC